MTNLLLRVLPILLFTSLLSITAYAAEGRFLGAKLTAYPSWFKESFLDIREDIAEATAEGKRVLLLFEQDGCPYCNLLVERNLSQKIIVDKLRSEFDVIAINMWGDREVTGLDGSTLSEKQFSEQLRVQFTPTILLFDEQGRVVLRLNGYLAPEKFLSALEYVAGRMEQKMGFREYLASQSIDRSSGKLNRQDFFIAPPYDFSNLDQPLAVFFEQKQCPACDRMHHDVLNAESVRSEMAPFTLAQLDMWSDLPVVTPDGASMTVREWAQRLNITYAPSIVLFSNSGQEVIRAEAFFKRFHTASLFSYVSSSAYRQQPNFQRYISNRAEEIRHQGKDVDIWK